MRGDVERVYLAQYFRLIEQDAYRRRHVIGQLALLMA